MTSKIFVVMSGYEFDGDTPRAAFTDEKAADEYSTEMSKKEKPLPFWIVQCDLDPRASDSYTTK